MTPIRATPPFFVELQSFHYSKVKGKTNAFLLGTITGDGERLAVVNDAGNALIAGMTPGMLDLLIQRDYVRFR